MNAIPFLWRMAQTAAGSMLDAIAPPRERSARTRMRTLTDIPLDPQLVVRGTCTVLTLTRYDEPVISDLIRSLKYENGAHAASLAAQALADFLTEEVSAIRAWSARPILIAPVPLHTTRERERGFNQIARVLAQLPRELRDGTNARVVPQLLVRMRDTAAQAKLPRRERLANVAGAFALGAAPSLANMHVILIDDVVTTGATMTHAAAPLLNAGATVTLVALARA